MTTLGTLAARTSLPQATTADDAGSVETTAEQGQVARDYPAGIVQIERSGLKTWLRITGGLAALGGATVLGLSLLSRRAPSAGASRLLVAPLLIGGGLVAGGAGSAFGAELLPPKSQVAVATKIPTQAKAGEIAGKLVGHETKIVKATDGTWAVLDEGPRTGYSSPSYNSGHYYGDGHFHGQHYYGDGHYHEPTYYEPYYPGSGDYYPTPSYPSNPGSGTSRGDDSGSSYTPPRYDPPAHNPPAHNPPANDPPSHNPPSSSYGNSSSNGNPSYDDF
jgi:hypothetical protein